MTEVSSAAVPVTAAPGPAVPRRRIGGWVPTWGLIATKLLELRKRRGIMVTAVLLIVVPPVLILGLRLIFHAADPKSYGPAGNPGLFSGLTDEVAEFGFIAAAVLGTAAGTTDLTDGMFRHLVVTGRSRLALYLARIPAGLAILLPLVAVSFAVMSLVTSYAGQPQPATVSVNGVSEPLNLSQPQLKTWLLDHPGQASTALQNNPVTAAVPVNTAIDRDFTTIYGDYTSAELEQENPSINEMVKIGLWFELDIGMGFMVGLGLGSLLGQRTVSTVLMIALQIIITPILAAHVIPYFLDGQRVDVGIALDQLRPAALGSGNGGGGGPPGHILFGGRGALQIPAMPTWAMITVIVGWIVGWTVIGAWRMATRDA
jgi:hypothetical protein